MSVETAVKFSSGGRLEWLMLLQLPRLDEDCFWSAPTGALLFSPHSSPCLSPFAGNVLLVVEWTMAEEASDEDEMYRWSALLYNTDRTHHRATLPSAALLSWYGLAYPSNPADRSLVIVRFSLLEYLL